jgi:hypothetical protein
VQDVFLNRSYTLIQNATYPNGLCVQSVCVPNPLQPCNGQLDGLESYYNLGAGAPVNFDGKNIQNVRGITCERWSRNITVPPQRNQSTPNISATVYFYFPVNSWSNRGESYHRLLKRIQVNGTVRPLRGSELAQVLMPPLESSQRRVQSFVRIYRHGASRQQRRWCVLFTGHVLPR